MDKQRKYHMPLALLAMGLLAPPAVIEAGIDKRGTYAGPVRPKPVKLGRNDPCHCGSGKKFKACCLRNQ